MMDSITQRFYSRRLRFEPLESRRLLSITVDTLVNENNGVGVGAGTSLREAIAAAAPGDTIDFSVTGTIVTSGLGINKNLTISGPGANLLTIQAFDSTPGTKTGNGTRAFYISDENSSNLLNVSLSGMTLTGGDSFGGGGAILTRENLVVSDCVITNNATSGGGYENAGGAILSDPGQSAPVYNSLTLRNCVISGNTANNAEGGAIRKRYGTLLIEDCTITGNSAYYGGGLSAADKNVQVQINRSTISNNRATYVNGYGGGIFTYNATVAVTASTISGNTAPTGGGIDASLSSLTLTDSVISNNSATGSTQSSYGGGGILAARAYGLTITRCTISGNTAATRSGGGVSTGYLSVVDSTISGNSAASGGGLYTSGGGKIVGSTFSGNTASSRGAAIDGRGPLPISFSTITANTSPVNSPGALRIGTLLSSIVAGNTNGDVNGAGTLGYNLIGTGGTFNKPGDQIGITNPMLGPLADNGGPTKTHAPLAGSPAIDTGNPAFDPANPDGNASTNDALPFDQRGGPFSRVHNGRIDKGAVERQPVSATVMGDYNQNGVVDASDYLVWQKMRGATGVTPYTGADGSGNGVVDQADYSLWRFHFGSTVAVAGVGSGASVEGGVGSGEGLASRVAPATSGTLVEQAPASHGGALELTSKDVLLGVFRSNEVGKRAHVAPPAEPGAVERVCGDALVACAEAACRAGGAGSKASRPNADDSIGKTGADFCDVLDVAVGELMGTAL